MLDGLLTYLGSNRIDPLRSKTLLIIDFSPFIRLKFDILSYIKGGGGS